MQVDILTPEHKIFSGQASAVQLPGSEGLFQVLDGHAPMISTLQEGQITIDGATIPDEDDEENTLHKDLQRDGNHLYLSVKGGVAEVQQGQLIILAD